MAMNGKVVTHVLDAAFKRLAEGEMCLESESDPVVTSCLCSVHTVYLGTPRTALVQTVHLLLQL